MFTDEPLRNVVKTLVRVEGPLRTFNTFVFTVPLLVVAGGVLTCVFVGATVLVDLFVI